jgi:hypothetical protein
VAAARIETWCREYELPVSTFRLLRAAGKGPKAFEVGRLIYWLRADWIAWWQEMAASGGTGRLSPPSGRLGRGSCANTAKG